MFDALSDRFDGIFKRLRGKGRLSDSDVDEVLREIRVALLEADVNLTVVRTVVARIREQCLGADLSKSLSPRSRSSRSSTRSSSPRSAARRSRITYASKPPTVVLMAGLQGSGKTTALGQARPLVQGAGAQPAAGRRRPPAPGRRRAAAHARSPDRRARLLASRPIRSTVAGGGVAEARRARPRRRHRRHRRPSRHRRRDDGAGPPDLGDRATGLHVPRRRRHDRSGRGHRRRGVPRDARARRRDPHEARRRRARWRGALGEGGRSAGRSRSRPPARSSPTSSSSIPIAWRAASSGMGDVLTPHREGRRGLREGRGRGRRGQAARGRVHLRRLPRADAAAQEDGPAVERRSV